ncbi:tyrosine-type recombinase/integrase [Microbispora sp. KK1-11]|uniref:tyrosine-type recombinase/integrase n=1 Tax=Microbispora sp. KK1-11 TaxID=2053005 RepID=UPI0037C8E441
MWNKVREDVGLPDLHFHDLRHVGNTLAAASGASLKELMARMGHASTRAALIYQHATRDRDRVIAEALGRAFTSAQTARSQPTTGHGEKTSGM